MDYGKLSSEVLRALRGPRSQTAFSRRIGYQGNVAAPWEQGRRFPSAGAFLNAARRIGLDIDRKLQRFLPLGPKYRARASAQVDVSELLDRLRGNVSQAAMAERVNSDRTTVARWLKGTTEPRLPELLAWVEASSSRLSSFLELFVDPATLPSMEREYRSMQQQLELAYSEPWTHAILRALELEAYQALPRHDAAFLARTIGISIAELDKCLEALVAANQVSKSRGLFRPRAISAVDTASFPLRNRELKRHWGEVALNRLAREPLPVEGGPHPGLGNLFAYGLLAVSHQEFVEIRRLHTEYYERVREIAIRSTHADRVVLMNHQLVDLGADGREP